MNSIAIIGAGRVGTALAKGLSATGHLITLGVRDPAAARQKWQGPDIPFAGLADAIRPASIVINATPGDCSLSTFSSLQAEMMGKILIDVANATVRGDDGLPSALIYSGSSLAEALQEALPHSFVVKTMNTLLSPVMANPSLLSSPATIFISGNDATAKAITRSLLLDLGWEEQWIEDLGALDSARGTEAVILLAPYLLRAGIRKPFALTAIR